MAILIKYAGHEFRLHARHGADAVIRDIEETLSIGARNRATDHEDPIGWLTLDLADGRGDVTISVHTHMDIAISDPDAEPGQ